MGQTQGFFFYIIYTCVYCDHLDNNNEKSARFIGIYNFIFIKF